MRKDYTVPGIITVKSFESSALACGKTTDPPPGSFHIDLAYETFTGHFGGGFSASESVSGSAGVRLGANSSGGYSYQGLCGNWVTYSS